MADIKAPPIKKYSKDLQIKDIYLTPFLFSKKTITQVELERK
tara:strand:+ start:107 stop:232 length:126 start_codon:yes stop_codon:yes gene_type:complete